MTTKAKVTRESASAPKSAYDTPEMPDPEYFQVDFDWEKLTEGIERPEKDYSEVGMELMYNNPLPTGGLSAQTTDEDQFDAYLMEFMF